MGTASLSSSSIGGIEMSNFLFVFMWRGDDAVDDFLAALRRALGERVL